MMWERDQKWALAGETQGRGRSPTDNWMSGWGKEEDTGATGNQGTQVGSEGRFTRDVLGLIIQGAAGYRGQGSGRRPGLEMGTWDLSAHM